jgi:uncharacterized protein (TIGR03083 family)
LLREIDHEQWAAPSRCAAWTVRDVVAHLVSTDQFWALSMTSALSGTPTRFLQGFDPVVTPARLVDGMQDLQPSEVLERFLDGVEQLASIVEGLDRTQWSMPSEAPPGHVSLHAAARHALWDAWTHERDIVVPLGLDLVDEDDEIALNLEYVAALSPAFVAMNGSTRAGSLAVDATDPDVHLRIEVGETVVVRRDGSEAPDDAAQLTGRAVDLVEALTFRTPFPAGIAAEHSWMFAGLAAAFDV